MKLIKLDAIDSTNDFLKKLSKDNDLENFTVVTAETQTNGRGQVGAEWYSESGKNLIVSVLAKNVPVQADSIFDSNVAVSVSISNILKANNVPNVTIKWPNDIMSDDKKIAGILIENTFKSDQEIYSIIGFGLNVNQTNFENLPKASSLLNICNKEFDRNKLLIQIIKSLETNIYAMIYPEICNNFWKTYNGQLYKKGKLTVFEDYNKQKFMGIIRTVHRNGKLVVEIENDVLKEYDLKEISIYNSSPEFFI